MTGLFEGNKDVVFGDINLSEGGPRGPPNNPGAGGWPTIRYFTKETGPDGASYTKRTPKPVCSELLDYDMMIDYIETASGTALCATDDGKNCNEKELAYLSEMKAKESAAITKEKSILDGMLEDKDFKANEEEWLVRRRRILSKLAAAPSSEGHTEL